MKAMAAKRAPSATMLMICQIMFLLLLGRFSRDAQAQVVLPGAGVITTVAGNGAWGNSGNGGQAKSAKLGGPYGVATDGAGNIYISDENYGVIRKVTASTGIITTVAGTGVEGYSGDGGAATSAKLDAPEGLVVNAAGDIYIVDTGNYRIRKVTASTGKISTVAGSGNQGYSGDGGPATSAYVNAPGAAALDSAGNLYIADTGNHAIRKVSIATGVITTVAGNGTEGFLGDGGAATSAELDTPVGVAVDTFGNIYISDLGNSRIRKVTAATGIITTLAGNGTEGFTGDGGPASSAEIDMPYGIALDYDNNVYFADFNANVVRMVAFGTDTISTVAGNGTAGFAGDGGAATSAELYTPYGVNLDQSGNLYIADYGNLRVRAVGTTLPVPHPTAPVITWSAPAPITYGNALDGAQLDATANVAGTFTYAPSSGTVLPGGVQALSVLFVPNDSTDYVPAMAAVPLTVTRATPQVSWPTPSPIVYGTALSSAQLDATSDLPGTFAYTPSSGAVLLPGSQTLSVTLTPTDTTDYQPVTATVSLVVEGLPGAGLITTIAGNGSYGRSGDGGQAVSAKLEQPGEIALDAAGNVYIPDLDANVVRKVTASTGVITTIAGTGSSGYSGDGGAATGAKLREPYGVAVDGAGNVYIADDSNQRIRRVAISTGTITTVAGTGVGGYSGDGGAATSAKIDDPEGLAVDASGNLYIADSNNGRVRKLIVSTGSIATVAGNGSTAYSGDGAAALDAGIAPSGVAVDTAGNLYISDSSNNRVREVNASTGIITTIAGNGTAGYTGDGSSAISAELNNPQGIAVDSVGNVYVADMNNSVVREISVATGTIMTVAGNGTAGYAGDGGPATSAELNQAPGVALDGAGNIYIGDCLRVREVGAATSGPVSVSIAPGSVELYQGQSQQFTAAVGNTSNTAVNWTITPAGVGSISSSGLYTAPASVAAQQIVTVVATSQADSTKSASSPVTLVPSVSVSLAPPTTELYASQTQQFTATVSNTENAAVSWSINPAGVGSISSSGLYTAPAAISSQQTVTISATSQADTTKSDAATVTLYPPIAVSVSPTSITLSANQTQQFAATVTNTTNTAVTWSISPSMGSISSSGLYTAPTTVSSQETVTVTATSQADSAVAASITMTLSSACQSSGYAFYRPVVIDHTRVPNTDQANFPFLFSTTDQTLATVANGGHVANVNGYDIIFSTDPYGQNPLSFEIEEYNPATGQVIAWVRIPSLSHTSDTVIYVLYGNPNITAPQQTPGAVWDSNYVGVWHVANGTVLSLNDSTSNGNNGTNDGAAPTAGQIDGGMATSQSSENSYASINPSTSLANLGQGDATFSAWVNPDVTIDGGIMGKDYPGWSLALAGGSVEFGGPGASIGLPGFPSPNPPIQGPPLSGGVWSYLTVVLSGGATDQSQATIYVNGVPTATGSWSTESEDDSGQSTYLGAAPALLGSTSPSASEDEFRISNTARSADWIATEYANQSSPATFYTLYAENFAGVVPSTTTLYASQSAQFNAVGTCSSPAVTWSLSSGAEGTLTSNGLYSAPSGIASQQIATITATSQADGSEVGTATVALMPPIAVSVNPGTATLYAGGQTQQFSASVSNATNTAVNWTVDPADLGSIDSNGLYTAPDVGTQQTATITAISEQDPTKSASATVTLPPSVQISVTPFAVGLSGGQTQQFAASVSNTSNTAVTWSINPVGLGTIDASGLYTAPVVSTPQSVIVTASSQAYPTAQGTSYINLIPLSVSPTLLRIWGGFSQQFTANPAATWSMSPSIGTLTASGLYTAPLNLPYPQNLTITATSVADPSVTVSVPVTVLAPYGYVFPATATVSEGASQQFSACVAENNLGGSCDSSSAAWSLNPGAPGSISSTGSYTAPAHISSSQTVTVTAIDNFNSQISYTATLTLVAPTISILPASPTLYAGQQQQFASTISNSPNTAVSWSLTPATGAGTLSSNGLYAAPLQVTTPQTVTVTATSQYDPDLSTTTTITLSPPVVSVSPAQLTVYGGEQRQFVASVNYTPNPAVKWSLAPAAGAGSVSSTGVYTAPAEISAQQTVTIKATSQADPSASASATITLSPQECASSGYAYVRPIVVNHNLVMGSDQVSFPILFSATDPMLATTVNGGHVQNANGYDIVFSSDPAGQNLLDFEIDNYNPVTGAGAFWIRVPVLSHTTDTTIFMWYGNSSVSTSQENRAGVWSNGYGGVWHFGPLGNLSTTDSTANGNNANNHGVTATGGLIGGAGSFDGTGNTYFDIPANNSFKPANALTLEAWVNMAAPTFYPDIFSLDYQADGNWNGPFQTYALDFSGGSLQPRLDIADNGQNSTNSSSDIPAGQWTHVVGTYDGLDMRVYVNGVNVDQAPLSGPIDYGTSLDLDIGSRSPYTSAEAVDGLIDEARISTVARSAGWIDTEYNNQSSPSTFATLYPELTGMQVVPGAVGLYASQNRQFVIAGAGTCSANTVIWSMPSDAPGTLTGKGFYTAPSAIGTQQTITVTATALGASNQQYTGTITLLPPLSVSVTPPSASLSSGQSVQLNASVANSASSAVTWSLNPAGAGTISASGIYTAPSSVTTEQTVIATATSAQDPTKSASATLTLLTAQTAPSAITVTPTYSTLHAGQSQQFTATVTNTSDPGVTWTIDPAGVGTISATGLYTAPSVTAQEIVTLTATSQADASLSATAQVTLLPAECASNGYGYQRVIVIDHTKVPNTDQSNFPFLFDTTDPDLASVANGGHVTNASGYDIFFSTDPTGASKLDHEIEQYNPATGQLIAWVRIPTLSHSADTVLYMFYGNPAVTSSQQNPSGVWDSHFQAVYHLANVTTASTPDSTSYANNANETDLSSASGVIDGGTTLNGTSSYFEIPNAAFSNYPQGTYEGGTNPGATTFTASVSMWFKTAVPGGLFQQKDAEYCNNFFFICISYAPTVPGVYDVPGEENFYVGENGSLVGPWGVTPKAYNDNQWHSMVVTYAANGTDTLYVDGQTVEVAPNQVAGGGDSSYAFFVGAADSILDSAGEGDFTWMYLNGGLDEVRVSNIARSGDWIRTEYNNQNSPSTFYQVYPSTIATLVPSAVSLYPSQTQQFTVTGTCSSAVTWTIPSGSPGVLDSTGLYTAPNVVSSPQSVTVTATSSASGSTLGSSTITLEPSPAPIVLSAESQPPYGINSTQTFEVSLLDPYGTPEPGVAVNFAVSGANPGLANATTDPNGVASWSYTGSNAGTDTVVATAVVNSIPLTSNSVTATWTNPTLNPDGMLALLGEPSLGRGGLVGAFTDGNGSVIEPITIGATASEFIVPPGATQLQLGIDDSYYPDNGGTGFVVLVNGAQVAVPPTAMPWGWASGGLNNGYQYGLGNGTAPVVAATGLTVGQAVKIAYQSGTVSANYPSASPGNANGDPSWITGGTEWAGAYFPTLYTSPTAYPVGQPISFTTVVTDGAGAPAANVPVTLTVSGANPGQYLATTDSTGTAAFTYTGAYPGTDNLRAQAVLAGNTLESSESTVTWTSYPAPTTGGQLTITFFATNGNQQGYVVLAKDAAGNPIQYANLGFYLSGADSIQQNAQTDASGQAAFIFVHQHPGPFSIVAADSVGRNVVLSTPYSNTWTMAGTAGSGSNYGVGASISAPGSVTLPNPIQLNGTITDTVSTNPVIQWSEVSGPGTVTFATPQQANTTATFNNSGTYVLQLAVSDAGASSSAQVIITVNPIPVTASSQGLIASPLNGSTVSGIVPITLAPGVNLQSGTLVYYPTADLTNVTTLNANATGTGQIGTLDTTALPNGSYWIQMQSTDTSGHSEYSLVLVTVAGNYKPGRVTTTVTDLVVPASGLPISIQRQYDSLNAGTSGDFGYGWNLATTVNLSVDPAGDVTFTLGGQRRTFYFTPQLFPLFDLYDPAFTPEAGMFGYLTESGPGCLALDFLTPDGSSWQCAGGGQYSPPGYIYIDPTGTSYTIGANGDLQSIVDRDGNTLTVTADGITSSTGLNVPFVRDSSGRITQITDPQGNDYLYTYDSSGNLETVTYPNSTQASTYTYDSAHHYTGGTDFRGNALPTTTYYGSTDTDPSGLPLNGRIESVTDALNETTSYAYDIANNTTTITYPPDSSGAVGHSTMVYDSYGDLLSSTDPLNHTTTNTYDANRNLISTTDALNHTTTYAYDANGHRTSTTYPATETSTNTTSTTQYNWLGEPTTATDELGNSWTFNYDGNYNPQSVTDSTGVLASYLFDANGRMQAGAVGHDIATQPGFGDTFTYDANGNIITKTDPIGRSTTGTFDSLGHRLTQTLPAPIASGGASPALKARRNATAADVGGSGGSSTTTSYQYDAVGNMTEEDAPLGRVIKWVYDPNGNKLSETDALNHTTTYTYDSLNRLITIAYPTQPVTTTTYSYDFRNNVVDSVDQNSHDTHYTYDVAGRLTAVTLAYGTPNASTTSYAYDATGRKTSETDSLGHTTTYTYDAAGNLLSVSGPRGNFTFAYDNARNRISATDGDGNTTTYTYDARRRLVKVTYPDGTNIKGSYDGAGNLTSFTDQAGNVVQYTYDAANELQSVVQTASPNSPNNTNNYGYDGNRNLISLMDANGHTTQKTFDVFSDLVSRTLPDGSLTESRTYDAVGNLTSLTNFSGKTTTFNYDGLNRLLSRVPDSSLNEPTISYTYTPTGRIATMTDASGTTSYTYDEQDRLTQKATPEGTLNYTYDIAGNLASMSSADGIVSVTYAWDNLNRLSSVTDGQTGGTTNYTYDGASNVATATYPNGLQSTFQYDQLNRMSSMTAGSTAGYLYQRGPTGLRTNATELSGRSVTWNYDGIQRLTGETVANDPLQGNGSASYTLDPVGNRSSSNSSLPHTSSGTFGFNLDDQLTGETYDSNGNVTMTGGNSFSYDSRNRLVTFNNGAVSMVYDGFGNRVAKTANGVTTRYLVDDLNPTGLPQVVEETVNGAPAREYTYGLQRIDENQIVNNAWTPSYYGYDGMGSVRQLTSAGGTVTDTYEYDAFGNKVASSGTTPNSYLYRAEQFDSDLGLYYLRARWYNPQTGRFLSQDPWSGWAPLPKTLHKYLYAGADPENRIDPTGWADLVEERISLEPEQRSEASVEYVGRRVACILTTTADVLDAIGQTEALGLVGSLTNVGYDLESCAGEAEGERPQQCSLCFAAGTPVHTNHGDVPVQDIKVGDEVLSENAKTGKTEYQPVMALTHPHLDRLLEIRIEGEAEPLRPSTGHPFWVRSVESDVARWVKAGDLRAGDFLETPNGGWRRVVSVKALAGEQTVYNFTVDQDHDYFVGQTGFLVHNANCGCKFPDNPLDMEDLLGFPGTQVPDGPYTGRNKWIWNLAKGVQLRFEAHPYFGPGAGPEEVNPHWQLKVPGKKKDFKWMPGEDIPGCK